MRQRFRRGIAQWPAVAGAWLVYGVPLLAISASILAATRNLLGQKLAVAIFLAFLLLAEAVALVLAWGALEALAPRALPDRWLDGLEALALGALVALPVASLVKFRATGVHLKASDFGFLSGSLAQVLQESLPSERRALAALAATLAAVAAGAYFGLRAARRRRATTPVRQILLLGLLAAGGCAYTYATYPTVERFARHVLPELHWLRALAASGFRTAADPPANAESRAAGAPITRYAPPLDPARPNVVLVMLESLPWARTSLGGGAAGVTPNLDRLARESVVFSRAYTASTHSDYAQMAILSSLHPRKFDEHDFYTAIDYPRTLLWDTLRPAGYATAMFSCQNERWGNMLGFLDTPGLDLLRHSPDWPDARHKGRGIESKVHEETPVREWMRWRARDGREPFFTYLNFQSNHFPYEIPPEAPAPFALFAIDFPASFFRYPREKAPVMLNRFHNALAYADRWLGEVVSSLEARAEWARTVLIVVSDHGEAFYEHDEPTHGSSLYEEQVRSFLLMRLPGVEGRIVDEPVSLLDIAPLLLRHLGLPPHGNFQGRDDVLEATYDGQNRPLFFTIQGITFEDGVLFDGWKYVVNWDRRQRRLFHLAEDPEERRDLLAERSDRASALDTLLRAFLARQLTYYRARLWQRGRYPAPLP